MKVPLTKRLLEDSPSLVVLDDVRREEAVILTESKTGQPSRGWTKRTILVVCVVSLFILLLVRGLVFHQWEKSWHLVHVQTTGDSFGDSRNLPLAVGVMERGGDPYAAVAHSPYPPLNYPRVWLWFFKVFGLKTHFVAFELTMVAAFLICVASLIYSASTFTGAVLCALAACTPAALLAVERGNTDLMVFALCYLGVVSTTAAAAWGMLFAATLFKLFPAAGLLLWALLKRSRWLVGLSLLTVAAYALLLRHSIELIRRNTPAPGAYAYGVSSLAKDMETVLRHVPGLRADVLGRVLPPIVELGALALGLYFFSRGRHFVTATAYRLQDARELRLFLVFALIFLATFLAGANYIYRLIFLLPTLPFLASVLEERRLRPAGLVAIGLVFLGMGSAPGFPAMWEPFSFLARTALIAPMAFLFGVGLATDRARCSSH